MPNPQGYITSADQIPGSPAATHEPSHPDSVADLTLGAAAIQALDAQNSDIKIDLTRLRNHFIELQNTLKAENKKSLDQIIATLNELITKYSQPWRLSSLAECFAYKNNNGKSLYDLLIEKKLFTTALAVLQKQMLDTKKLANDINTVNNLSHPVKNSTVAQLIQVQIDRLNRKLQSFNGCLRLFNSNSEKARTLTKIDRLKKIQCDFTEKGATDTKNLAALIQKTRLTDRDEEQSLFEILNMQCSHRVRQTTALKEFLAGLEAAYPGIDTKELDDACRKAHATAKLSAR